MKKLFFALLSFGFLIASNVSAKDASSGGAADIRYRAIIYFYPQTVTPTEAELTKYLPDFERVDALPETITKPVVTLSILDDFKEFYPVPDDDYLAYFGRGISKTQAMSIQTTKQILLIDIGYPQTNSLSDYKSVVNFLFDVANTHKGLIWDAETRELFEPSTWAEKRITPWQDKFPNIVDHITIHAYSNEPEGIRTITLGMAKFGLPDIVVNDFSWSSNHPVGNLINLTAQSLFEGVTPNENATLKLNISKLQNTAMRQTLLSDLKENAASELEIEFGEGKREEGDPYNVILELLFDTAEGANLSEKQDKILSALFGWEDSVTMVQHDTEILAASTRAKARLNKLRKDFNKGLEPGEYILLKAPFKTDTGGNEWMWVEVITWEKKAITGLLKNEPYYVPELRAGSIVEINQNDVFDYIRELADGTSEGNETDEIMKRGK